MKQILITLGILFSTVSVAQKSVKLELKYKKGDTYLMEMTMNQDSPLMAMNMKLTATQEIVNIKNGNFLTKMNFDKISMDMMQGGMQMGASTEDKDEDLDAMGKQVKSQLSQMLAVIVSSEVEKTGKIVTINAEPNLPGMEQMTNQNSTVVYPDKALKVGDSWADEKTQQGVITKTIYTVAAIKQNKILLDLSGTVSGIADGTLSGKIEIDKKTGVPLLSKTKVVMETQGQKVSVGVEMTMKKV